MHSLKAMAEKLKGEKLESTISRPIKSEQPIKPKTPIEVELPETPTRLQKKMEKHRGPAPTREQLEKDVITTYKMSDGTLVTKKNGKVISTSKKED